MICGALPFQPSSSVCSARGAAAPAAADGRLVDGASARPAEDQRIVVRRHGNQRVALPEDGIHRRVNSDRILRFQADDRRVFKQEERLPVRLARQLVKAGQIDLVAVEIQELRVDHGESRLPAGLGDDPGDDRILENQLRLSPGGNPGDLQIPGLLQRGDDVIRLLPAARRIDDGQDGLDHVGVAAVVDNDRAGRLEADHVQVVQVDGAAVFL